MAALCKHSTLNYVPSLCPVLSHPVYLPDRPNVYQTPVSQPPLDCQESLAGCEALSLLSV